MGETEQSDNASSSMESNSKIKGKSRAKKRKRESSNSSSDEDDVLPENTLEMEKNLHAAAAKNNLNRECVKKILKKVVTNDHVLALVKLREEEEDSSTDESLRPTITRAKAKELKNHRSPKPAPWDLSGIDLSPIKHIPVKTRPEVEALIAQELPEDEDDDEYDPTHDDVPSDDDHVMESCSDMDSQPTTPATPKSQKKASPKVINDGPFKVPQELSTPVRRKLDLDEEATIALRTRSKLSLSATSIEHIESSFVPPDDLPMPVVDDLWNEFLEECLNPASNVKHEDDDEADPEYNVAADPDAPDEDEEALENSIIKISKKELNDLVGELFSIIPDSVDVVTPSEAQGGSQNNVVNKSLDCHENNTTQLSNNISESEHHNTSFSIGKTEPPDMPEGQNDTNENAPSYKLSKDTGANMSEVDTSAKALEAPNTTEVIREMGANMTQQTIPRKPLLTMSITEENVNLSLMEKEQILPPLSLQSLLKNSGVNCIEIQVEGDSFKMSQVQVLILQQQLRQHVQLAAGNFLQLFANPIHWTFAPKYKEYLLSLKKLTKDNPNSVANVYNLDPAIELVNVWEECVSQDTPDNAEMVEFIMEESDRWRRRALQNNSHTGDFPRQLKQVIVSSSAVFAYPKLLPPTPYRPDITRRRSGYLHSEDALIAMGLQQFWPYVEANPSLYPMPSKPHPRQRWGLSATVELVARHTLPHMSAALLLHRVQHCRRSREQHNPIVKFFNTGEVESVTHELIPYDPKKTLYQQSEDDLPRIWIRYLAENSMKFKKYLHRRTKSMKKPPDSVNVCVESISHAKVAVPYEFTKIIKSKNGDPLPPEDIPTPNTTLVATQSFRASNIFSLINTSKGAVLVPLTSTVMSNTQPICTSAENKTTPSSTMQPKTPSLVIIPKEQFDPKHCCCCLFIKKICKQRQTLITEYLKTKRKVEQCDCTNRKYPRVTNRLTLLVNNYRNRSTRVHEELQDKIEGCVVDTEDYSWNWQDLAYVASFQMKMTLRSMLVKNAHLKRNIYTLMSNFLPDVHNPVYLANQLFKVLGIDMVDIYKEFLGFLTAKQADEVHGFKDYFIQTCLSDLIAKIEDEVKDKQARKEILSHLSDLLKEHYTNSCDMCTKILNKMKDYPALAKYVFSLFPHRQRYKLESDKMCNEKEFNKSNDAMVENKEIELNKDAGDDVGSNDTELNKEQGSKITELNDSDDEKLESNGMELNNDDDGELGSNGIELNDGYDKKLRSNGMALNDDDDKKIGSNGMELNDGDDKKLGSNGMALNDGDDKKLGSNGMELNDGDDKKLESNAMELNDGDEKLGSHGLELNDGEDDKLESNGMELNNGDHDKLGSNGMKLNNENDKGKVHEENLMECDENNDSELCEDDNVLRPVKVESNETELGDGEAPAPGETMMECNETHASAAYEADHSSSDEDDTEGNLNIIENEDHYEDPMTHRIIKREEPHRLEMTICKTEVQDSDSSSGSLTIDTSEVSVKSEKLLNLNTELTEWRRDEDKIVLEVLKQHLVSDMQENKTIIEVIEKDEVLTKITSCLAKKSMYDVKRRILYLLQLLVLNDIS